MTGRIHGVNKAEEFRTKAADCDKVADPSRRPCSHFNERLLMGATLLSVRARGKISAALVHLHG
jgi:hypothetical protein